MMSIADDATYCKHRSFGGKSQAIELCITALVFASVGAVTWAIRGTTGWDGVDGTIVPGFTWGLLWYYVCQRKGIDARGIPLWLGLGIALGGELGYGQYVSWIRGQFATRDGAIPISPWLGYAWFMVCGIGWGAPGGIVLGWALHSKVTRKYWAFRSLLFIALLFLLFNSAFIDWLGARFVHLCPRLLFPNATTVNYSDALDNHLGRTIYTNTQNACVLAWWCLAMLCAALHKDRFTLTAGTIIGGGFGLAFPISALWCLGYVNHPGYIDWWKMWELNAGVYLGILYVLVLYWSIRHVDPSCNTQSPTSEASDLDSKRPGLGPWSQAIFAGLGVYLFTTCTFSEHFQWTGILLGLFYLLCTLLATRRSIREHDTGNALQELQCRVSIIYSTFLLLFILLHGGSSKIGAFLKIYDIGEMDQYGWPPGRILLFSIPAAFVTMLTLVIMARALYSSSSRQHGYARLPERMIDLIALICVIGILTIWPSQIAGLYAALTGLAIASFTRLNRHFDKIDATTTFE